MNSHVIITNFSANPNSLIRDRSQTPKLRVQRNQPSCRGEEASTLLIYTRENTKPIYK